MGGQTVNPSLSGLVFTLLLLQRVETQSSPQVDPDKDRQDIFEGKLFQLTCTFDSAAFSRFMSAINNMEIVLGTAQVPIPALGVSAVLLAVSGDQIPYRISFLPDKTHSDFSITCGQRYNMNGSLTMYSRSTELNVQYPPAANVSGVDVHRRNITLQQQFPVVALNACAIVSDPGNPEAIVTWPAVLMERGSVSGLHQCILTFNVSRADNDQQVTARAENIVGFTLKTFQLIVNGPPSQVLDPKCVGKTLGFQCSWGKQSDSGGFPATSEIEYKTGSSSWSSDGCTVVGLGLEAFCFPPGTPGGVTFSVRVRAVSVLGQGEPQNTTAVTLPEPPHDISIKSVSRTEVKVDWKAVQVSGTQYSIDFPVETYMVKISGEKHQVVTTRDTFFNFKNLTQDTLYNVRVASGNAFGVGTYSISYSVRTLEAGVPGIPQRVEVTVVSGREIYVWWDVPDAGGAGYRITGSRVELFRGDGLHYQAVLVDAQENSTTVGNLLPGTRYTVRVYSRNEARYGNGSIGISVNTTEFDGERECKGPSVSLSDGAVAGISLVGFVVGCLVGVVGTVCLLVRFWLPRRDKHRRCTSTNEMVPGSSSYESPARIHSQATYADIVQAEQTETTTNLTSNPAYSTNAGR